MRDAGGGVDDEAAKKPGSRLRRRFRRALIAYARVSHRGEESADRIIVAARKAALGEIGKRGAEDADRLGRLEAGGSATQTAIRMGVVKPLNDLVLDWGQPEK